MFYQFPCTVGNELPFSVLESLYQAKNLPGSAHCIWALAAAALGYEQMHMKFLAQSPALKILHSLLTAFWLHRGQAQIPPVSCRSLPITLHVSKTLAASNAQPKILSYRPSECKSGYFPLLCLTTPSWNITCFLGLKEKQMLNFYMKLVNGNQTEVHRGEIESTGLSIW